MTAGPRVSASGTETSPASTPTFSFSRLEASVFTSALLSLCFETNSSAPPTPGARGARELHTQNSPDATPSANSLSEVLLDPVTAGLCFLTHKNLSSDEQSPLEKPLLRGEWTAQAAWRQQAAPIVKKSCAPLKKQLSPHLLSTTKQVPLASQHPRAPSGIRQRVCVQRRGGSTRNPRRASGIQVALLCPGTQVASARPILRLLREEPSTLHPPNPPGHWGVLAGVPSSLQRAKTPLKK